MMDDDLSKSELFELSGDFSSGRTSTDSIQFSSLELDGDLEAFKDKQHASQKRSFELKQSQHDCQVLRAELAQRDQFISNIKIETANKCETLQEQNHSLAHQNQMLNARLNEITAMHQEEDTQKQELIKLELDRILVRQKELEANNERFVKSEREMKKELKNIDVLLWTNEEYEMMCRRDEDLLSIKEFATLKLHQTTRPLKLKLDEFYDEVVTLQFQLKEEKDELKRQRQVFDDEKRTHTVNSQDNQKLYYELADAKSLLQQANFKRDNYDKTKHERDDFERRFLAAEAGRAKCEASLQVFSKERDDLVAQLNTTRQEISLLKQDKDYLSKQHADANSRAKCAEDKLEQTAELYEDAKRTKESLYEQYMRARDSYKSEYEMKLVGELDTLRVKTSEEIEKLRETTRDFYEREIQVLRESKGSVERERDKNELNNKELECKYREAVDELRVVQLGCENQLSELKSELKLKQFELDRARMLSEEATTNYKKTLIENEKAQRKSEIVQKEYHSMQMQCDKRVMELESELNEKTSRLQNYEKCEDEMDMVLRRVAEETSGDGNDPGTSSIDDTQAEKLLLSYGYGSNLMLNAKRRIQQNVHLTKRILHLEQVNTTLRHELGKERKSVKELEDQVDVAKSVIANTKQPHEFLVRSIQSKEIQLKKQSTAIEIMSNKIDGMESERERLLGKQNEMKVDIEKLIRNNEELFSIRDALKKQGLMMHNKRVLRECRQENNTGHNSVVQPKPLMFTSAKSGASSRSNSRNRSVSPANTKQQRYKLRKSPSDHYRKPIYTVDQS